MRAFINAIEACECARSLPENAAIPDFDSSDIDYFRNSLAQTYGKLSSRLRTVGMHDVYELELAQLSGRLVLFAVHAMSGLPVGYLDMVGAEINIPAHRMSIAFIDPAHQRKGLGLAMYEALLNAGFAIVADRDQTHGARMIWRNLARKGLVYRLDHDNVGQPLVNYEDRGDDEAVALVK